MPEIQQKKYDENGYKTICIHYLRLVPYGLNSISQNMAFHLVVSIVDKQKVICILQTLKENMSTRIHIQIVCTFMLE